MNAPVNEFISCIDQFRGNTTIVGTSTNGIFMSSGLNWESKNDGLTSLHILDMLSTPDGNLFAGTVEGIYQFDEANEIWIYKETGETVACFSKNSEGDVFAGGRGKIFRSNDKGQTWMSYPIEDAPEYLQIESLQITSLGTIFATVPEILKTYRSTDNGATWEIVRSEDGVTSLASNSQGHIYAAIDGVGIEFSTDNGVSWEKLSDEFSPGTLME